jgi:hypothetical protein
VAPGDLLDYLDWRARRTSTVAQAVVRIGRRGGTAAVTMNRGIAAVRGTFEYLLVVGPDRRVVDRLPHNNLSRPTLPNPPTLMSDKPVFYPKCPIDRYGIPPRLDLAAAGEQS